MLCSAAAAAWQTPGSLISAQGSSEYPCHLPATVIIVGKPALYKPRGLVITKEVQAPVHGTGKRELLRAWSISTLHLGYLDISATNILPSSELTSGDVAKSAILSSDQTESWLLIFSSQEERDSFVCAMQILQLYQALAQHCGLSTPKKGETATDRENEETLLRQNPQLESTSVALQSA